MEMVLELEEATDIELGTERLDKFMPHTFEPVDRH
jgi:hypothetical protein